MEKERYIKKQERQLPRSDTEQGNKQAIPFTFEEIVAQNRNRIYYQMQRLNIRDPHQEFYAEGLFAMWQAYQKYEPDKGPLATYFNFAIRNHLIDKIRKNTRDQEKDEIYIEEQKENFKQGSAMLQPVKQSEPGVDLEKEEFWQAIRGELTEKQWAWVYHHIIEGRPLKEIAEMKAVSLEAVKGWGKSARGKLRKVYGEKYG